jgi:hypothetical protein
LALRVPAEAAEAIGVSPDYVDPHVRPELRLIREGRLVLVSVRSERSDRCLLGGRRRHV